MLSHIVEKSVKFTESVFNETIIVLLYVKQIFIQPSKRYFFNRLCKKVLKMAFISFKFYIYVVNNKI